MELLIYSKGKETVTRLAMKPVANPQENPVEMTAERKDQRVLITLNFLGNYQATFPVSSPD